MAEQRDPRVDPRAGDVLRDTEGVTVEVLAYEFHRTCWRVRWTVAGVLGKSEFAGHPDGFRRKYRRATILHTAQEPAHAD